MMSDLKRLRDTQEDASGLSPASKRRILGASSPAGNGNQSPLHSNHDGEEGDGVEDWMKVVETHRKEAIYRQMLEYKRASRDAAFKVRELESQKKRLEASEHAVEACWTQLVSVIENLVGRRADISTAEALEPALDEAPKPLVEALTKRSAATHTLVSRFIQAAKDGSASLTNEELQSRCAKLGAENLLLTYHLQRERQVKIIPQSHTDTNLQTAQLKAANKSLRADIINLSDTQWQTRHSLDKARKLLDKQKMDHDKAILEMQSSTSDIPRVGTPGVKTNGPVSGHATPNGKVGSPADVKPVLDDASALLADTSALERLAESRQSELTKALEENTALKTELDRLRQLALNPSEEALRSAPFFQIYLRQIATQAADLSATRTRFQAAESQLDELRNQNLAFRDAVITDARSEAEALRQQVGKQNSDLARVRGQRDEMQAELAERRLREESGVGALKELEVLSQKQKERIGTLISEAQRLRGELGAREGERAKGYLAWLKREGPGGDYVAELEQRVRDAEIRLSAVSPAESAAAAEKLELSKAKQELERYTRIFGQDNVTGDAASLVTRLEEADSVRQKLELQLQASEASTNSLYTEVESLATLSDSLSSQLASKSFNLADVELRMSRLATEKAKADNKYFAAMRTKEAIEAECRTAQRSVEKQARLLEKAIEVEKGLMGQVGAQEKMINSLKNEARDVQEKWVKEEQGRREGELRLGQAQSTLQEANNIMQQRVAEAAAEKQERIKYQEEAEKLGNQVKKLKERQDALVSAASGQGVSAGEVHLKEERDKLMKLLRCSTCEQNFKQQMIVKCGHTFCKPCLDVRISTRQRKCPACGLAFAKEDVQTIYWQ